MNPFDVFSTRLSNQPVNPVTKKGLLYDNLYDCAKKTYRNEGIRGMYKGFWAHYLRLGPHTILTLVFWEQCKMMTKNLGLAQ
jgi:solute carrier family 25 protein 34/35